MYIPCVYCLNMKVLGIKLGVGVTCRAESRHLSLGIGLFSRKVFSRPCAFRFCSSGHVAGDKNEDSKELLTFENIVSLRRKQAKNSLLIEASSKNNFERIYKICEKFGPVKATFNYSQTSGKEMYLVECATSEMQQEILKYCHYSTGAAGLPVYSRLVYLASNVNGIQPSNHSMPESAMEENMVSCKTIAEQMERLYMNGRLEDLGTRLRFLICQLVEDAVVGLFPHVEVLPFGSSVNGFGRDNCDLDMSLAFNTFSEAKTHVNSELCFFARRQSSSERKQSQRNLEVIGDMISTFFPGVENVNKILRARIPIIAFYHSVTGIECDLSLNNRCAFYMSELLYLYGELDSRVRPLVFTVRLWAKRCGLARPGIPGPWVSNFTLTVMVLFFLQNRPVPILPSIQSLIQLADSDDHKHAEGIDCTFQRKIWKIPTTGNTEDAGLLLAEFFLFYEKFNFSKRGLSLFTGKEMLKPDGSTMYIENPLERQLNVSRNVGIEEVDRLRESARSSIWKLESSASAEKSIHWGILKLLEINPEDHNQDSHKGVFAVGRLFEESESSPGQYVVSAVPKKNKLSDTELGSGLVRKKERDAVSIPKSNSKNINGHDNVVGSGLVRKKERDTGSLQYSMIGQIENSNSKNIKSPEDMFVDRKTKSRRKRRNPVFKFW